MKVIEKYNDSLHNPYWKFQLGRESYEVKDTPKRVAAMKDALGGDDRFEAPHRGEVSRAPDCETSTRTTTSSGRSPRASRSDSEEIYPDLFPGEGARLPQAARLAGCGAGIWCTDAVTPIMRRTYEVARASAETALTGAKLLAGGVRAGGVFAVPSVGTPCRPAGVRRLLLLQQRRHRGRIPASRRARWRSSTSTTTMETGRRSSSRSRSPCSRLRFTAIRKWSIRTSGDMRRGRAAAREKGTNLNLPLPLGIGREAYLPALDRFIEAAAAFDPDYLIIAAGFDTYRDDPIGQFKLDFDDYREIGRRVMSLGVPTLICQEGGYNVEALGWCLLSFLDGVIAGGTSGRAPWVCRDPRVGWVGVPAPRGPTGREVVRPPGEASPRPRHPPSFSSGGRTPRVGSSPQTGGPSYAGPQGAFWPGWVEKAGSPIKIERNSTGRSELAGIVAVISGPLFGGISWHTFTTWPHAFFFSRRSVLLPVLRSRIFPFPKPSGTRTSRSGPATTSPSQAPIRSRPTPRRSAFGGGLRPGRERGLGPPGPPQGTLMLACDIPEIGTSVQLAAAIAIVSSSGSSRPRPARRRDPSP